MLYGLEHLPKVGKSRISKAPVGGWQLRPLTLVLDLMVLDRRRSNEPSSRIHAIQARQGARASLRIASFAQLLVIRLPVLNSALRPPLAQLLSW